MRSSSDEMLNAVRYTTANQFTKVLRESLQLTRSYAYIQRYGCDDAMRILAPEHCALYYKAGTEGFFQKIVDFIKYIIGKVIGFFKVVSAAITNFLFGRRSKPKVSFHEYADDRDALEWYERVWRSYSNNKYRSTESASIAALLEAAPDFLKFIHLDHAAESCSAPDTKYKLENISEKIDKYIDVYGERVDQLKKLLEQMASTTSDDELLKLIDTGGKPNSKITEVGDDVLNELNKLSEAFRFSASNTTVRKFLSDKKVIDFYKQANDTIFDACNSYQSFIDTCDRTGKDLSRKLLEVQRKVDRQELAPSVANKILKSLADLSREITDPVLTKHLTQFGMIRHSMLLYLAKILHMEMGTY